MNKATENKFTTVHLYRSLILLFFFLSFTKLRAQNDSIMKYLNDNRRSVFNNVIKTDISQISQGNVQFIFEHEFSIYFRLEGGIGLLASSLYNPPISKLYRDGTDPFNDKGLQKVKMNPGLSLYLSPRYPFKNLPAYYLSFNALMNIYFGQLFEGDFSLTFGKEINLGNDFILDINGGLGVDRHWSVDGYYYMHKFMIYRGKDATSHNSITYFFPVNFKLGYRLH